MVQKNDVLVGFGMNDPIPLDFQIPEVEEVPPIQPQPQGDEVTYSVTTKTEVPIALPPSQ
jgi:hypothetical protein